MKPISYLKYLPTPEQVEAERDRINASWDDAIRAKRRRAATSIRGGEDDDPEPWTFPEYSARVLVAS